MRKHLLFPAFPILTFLLAALTLQAQQEPLPTSSQLRWSGMEFYLFMHFGPNTFSDLEWGKGTESEQVFNPTALDCRQWCRIALAAGAKGIIITAKHHDGFCLWPSRYSKHTVRESPWKHGKGDVLKELSQACKEYGLKFGVYLSPWDRNHPKYGTAEYNDVFVNMMKEIIQQYGPIFEFWWDGANGEGPNGKKQQYDWHRFEATMRANAPHTVVFSDIGPDIRWVGNESGIAGKTNWNLLDTAGFNRGAGAPPTDTLNAGNENGHNWIPAECDVSIRPGWFYHVQEDDKVKTPEQLFDLYLKSVGRGSNLLLNVPPDRRGLINAHDSAALVGFRKLREQNLSHDLASKATSFIVNATGRRSIGKPVSGHLLLDVLLDQNRTQAVQLDFGKPQELNCVVLREDIKKGQHCKKFTVQIVNDKKEKVKEISGTTIGRKRILSFPTEVVSSILITVQDQKSPTALHSIEAYHIVEQLVEKE